MKTKSVVLASVLSMLGGLPSGFALEEGGIAPFVQSIQGDSMIVIVTPDGKNVNVEKGSKLNVGDHLRTGPTTSAVVKYPDGSKLFLGRGTDVVLGKNTGNAQWNELTYGQVRGVIQKPKGMDRPATPRFLVRSKAAVMGVRGTDFMFKATEGVTQSEVRTLEGEVEVAKSEQALLEGKGVSVTEGKMVEADQEAVKAVKNFDKEKYLKQLEAMEPELMKSANMAPQALKSSASVEVDQKPKKTYGKRFRLLKFEAGGIAFTPSQETFYFNYSGQISWTPSLRLLWDLLHLKGHVGATMFRSSNTGSLFPVLQVAILPAIHLFNIFFVEGGLGYETWFNAGSNGLLITGNTGILLGRDKFFERLYFGGAYVLRQGGSRVSQRDLLVFRVGLGFQIP